MDSLPKSRFVKADGSIQSKQGCCCYPTRGCRSRAMISCTYEDPEENMPRISNFHMELLVNGAIRTKYVRRNRQVQVSWDRRSSE